MSSHLEWKAVHFALKLHTCGRLSVNITDLIKNILTHEWWGKYTQIVAKWKRQNSNNNNSQITQIYDTTFAYMEILPRTQLWISSRFVISSETYGIPATWFRYTGKQTKLNFDKLFYKEKCLFLMQTGSHIIALWQTYTHTHTQNPLHLKDKQDKLINEIIA